MASISRLAVTAAKSSLSSVFVDKPSPLTAEGSLSSQYLNKPDPASNINEAILTALARIDLVADAGWTVEDLYDISLLCIGRGCRHTHNGLVSRLSRTRRRLLEEDYELVWNS